MSGTCRLCKALLFATPTPVVNLEETPDLRVSREHNDLMQTAARHLQQHHPEIFQQMVGAAQQFCATLAGKLLDNTSPEFDQAQRHALLLVWFLTTAEVKICANVDGKTGQVVA